MAADPPETGEKAGCAAASLGSSLCTSCGLCCEGALHNAAVLDDDEIIAAKHLGLPVLDRAKPGFRLPCPKLAGSVCSIYGSRPRVCGRYRCNLLQRLDRGDVSLDEALGTVRIARSLVKALKRAMPDDMTLPEARVLALRPRLKQPAVDVDAATRLRLAATAAVVYIDKHFRNAREGKLLRFDQVAARQKMVSDDEKI